MCLCVCLYNEVFRFLKIDVIFAFILYNLRCFINLGIPTYLLDIASQLAIKLACLRRKMTLQCCAHPLLGKLIQYIVEDGGGHVFAGQCYAEIEVTVVTGLPGYGREGGKELAGMD